MAGYKGYSMSNNAVTAYNKGERPYSKWSKKDIIEAIEEALLDGVIVRFDLKLLKSTILRVLRVVFLKLSSWHHTSKFYNKTNFFSFDKDNLQNITNETFAQIIEMDRRIWKASRANDDNNSNDGAWLCQYMEWDRSRCAKLRGERIKAKGIVKGSWFYLPDGSKKNINAKYFRMIHRVKDSNDHKLGKVE